MKKNNDYVYLFTCSIFFCVSLGILLINEFKYAGQHIVLQYVTTSLLLLSLFIFSKVSRELITKASAQVKYSFIFIIFMSCIHFTLNSINLYSLTALPPLFYTLKLHRFISLSSSFIVQLLASCIGYYLLSAKTQSKKIIINSRYEAVALTCILVVLMTQTNRAFALIYKDSIQVAVNMNTAFNDRFTYRLGGTQYYGWIWPYSQFVIKHTPEDAIIAIPPQSVIWKQEGNNDYFRWFIYPRTMVKELPDGSIPAEADYALIALGECGEGDCGWPKVSIPKEQIARIILIDRVTQQETVLTDTDYVLDKTKYTWGLIEFKK